MDGILWLKIQELMSTQLVPVTIQIEYECALLALQIADRQSELARLQRELAPLETAFGLFERKVASRSSQLTAERNLLRKRCKEIEHYTIRLHARLLADPDGHLSGVFTPEELRAIGELFGIDVPDEWFGGSLHATTSGNWEWAEEPFQFQRERSLPAEDQADLRTLYRQLAKAWHPDLALDGSDLEYRQEMMLRINHAWQARDLAAMRQIEQEHHGLLDPGIDRTRLWQMERLQRDLAQMVHRCARAQARLAALRKSKTRALWHDTALANAAIARHVRKLETEIEQLRVREVRAIDDFRIAFGQYAARD